MLAVLDVASGYDSAANTPGVEWSWSARLDHANLKPPRLQPSTNPSTASAAILERGSAAVFVLLPRGVFGESDSIFASRGLTTV